MGYRTEERNQFLVAFADAIGPLASATDIMSTAARLLCRELKAGQVTYADIDEARELAIVERDWCEGAMVSAVGRHRVQDFGAEVVSSLRAGRTVVKSSTSDRSSGQDEERLVDAFIYVPLVKCGALVAVLGVLDGQARTWSDAEVRLAESVAERLWPAVQRARAEQELRETKLRLQQALDAAELGTGVWHIGLNTSDADTRWKQHFGVAPDSPLTMHAALTKHVHPDDGAAYAKALQQSMEPGGSGALQQELRVVDADGTIRWVAIKARTIFEGTPPAAVRMIGVSADITDRRIAEAALKESEERLKEVDRRKDEFLAVLSHELRNPLGPIRTGLELIRLANNASDVVGRVRPMMERQMNHMVRLVDDLLDVSRIASGKIRLQPAPTPLSELIHMAVEAHRAALDTRKLALSITLPERPVAIHADATRFVQVVSNVLHNAIKFTEPRGTIAIQADLGPDDDVVISITDSGAGISGDMLPRVFELFSQEDAALEQTRTGLGIGLALARRLIEMHGGTIGAMSEGPGKGSTFVITIPIAPFTEALTLRPPVHSRNRGPRRVLVIDDNVDGADAIAALVRISGGDCRVAYDGASGLSLAVDFNPDVVLLDIGMPGIDGYETCRRIRDELGRDIAVVAISGWAQDRDKERAKDAGFDAHLTKPVDPNTLKKWLAPSAA